MALSITIFSILWSFASDRLNVEILLQFILAIPLLYLSSISYTKVAYWKEVELWEYLGWFTGTTATALVLNVIGILIFFLGYPLVTLIYFFTLWSLLLIYTLINIYYNPDQKRIKLFKFFFFVAIQLIFGVGLLFV